MPSVRAYGLRMESSEFSLMPTSALVDRLKSSGFDVPVELADEIVRRGRDAIEPLSALVRDDALWDATTDREGVVPIHAVHLLGAIGDAACTPVLVDAVKTRDWGDFLTESARAILGALDPAAIPQLREAALDATLDLYVRCAFAGGLFGIGARHPPHRAEVADFFTRILGDPDDELVSLLVDEACMVDDPAVQAAVDAAFDEGRVDPMFFQKSDIEELRAEPRWSLPPDIYDPMTYFRSGLLGQMKRNVEEEERRRATPTRPLGPQKIGRNEPCPCGSGKKYKKCCLR
ncbi:SEC-C motif domain protein [Minicystis rosea]|nr:SEC-C motif domain protein [Minicystis rosea]